MPPFPQILTFTRKKPPRSSDAPSTAIELPHEIIHEILSHLRDDLAAHPTALSNSGLQMALTCRWLYRELKPEIEAHQGAILASAMVTELPGPAGHTTSPLLRVFGDASQSWKTLSPDVLVELWPDKLPGAISRIHLHLPVLRSLDTDLICTMRDILLKLPATGPSLNSLHLSLSRHGAVETDVEKRRKWARSIFRLLDTITSLKRVWLHILFTPSDDDILGSVRNPESSSEGEYGGPASLSHNEMPPWTEMHQPTSRSYLTRLRDFLRLAVSAEEQAPSIEFKGPLGSPIFYPYSQHIIHSSRMSSFSIQECAATERIWTSILHTPDFPQLFSLTLNSSNVPLTVLFPFLERQSHLYSLHFTQPRDKDAAPFQPPAKPTILRIQRLTGDPCFLKTLFNSNVRLPNLRALTIRSKLYGSNDEDIYPGSWPDFARVLALMGQKSVSPSHLTLETPQSQALNEWLGTILQPSHAKDGGGWQWPFGALSSVIPRGQATAAQHTSLDEIAPPLSLRESLQRLKSVESLDLVTSRQYQSESPEPLPTNPKLVVEFISALPSVEEAYFSTQFTTANDTLGSSSDAPAEFLSSLRAVWSASRTLKTLKVYDTGAGSRKVWRRGAEELTDD